MAKEVIWTPRALTSFDTIINYLKEEWTDTEVRNFIELTNRIVKYISESPKMFRKTNKKNIYEALITPHNLLIYKTYPDSIIIITFWDTRRNPKKKKF